MRVLLVHGLWRTPPNDPVLTLPAGHTLMRNAEVQAMIRWLVTSGR